MSPMGTSSVHDEWVKPICIEALQRIVAMTAIQFVLFEPESRVQGNDEFKVAADKMIAIIIAQLKTLKTKKSDWQ